MLRLRRLLLFVALATAASNGWAAGEEHHDPSASVAATLALILLAAKLGGELAVRLGQAAVLGELVVGVLLGNLHLLGLHGLEGMAQDQYLDLFARLGVLLLLFEVGLESTVRQMWEVGVPSLLVALTGVAVPFGLGWLVSAVMIPDAGIYADAFLGATLCATSVGITARVLKDIGQSKGAEARIVLGAAVIDDVLGLIILAVVTGAIAATSGPETLSILSIAVIVLKALGFLAGALLVGLWVTPRVFRAGSRLRVGGVMLTLGLSFCFLLAWIADLIGLAPIVGAFAAGLILEPAHLRSYVERGEQDLEHLLQPISSFLVPVFFVVMGMRTNLAAFGNVSVLGLAAVMIVAAVAGKVVAGMAVAPAMNRLAIGIGMVPRGEVGLIFANIGLTLSVRGQPVVSGDVFAAIVLMVIVTTMITPPLLKWAVGRKRPS